MQDRDQTLKQKDCGSQCACVMKTHTHERACMCNVSHMHSNTLTHSQSFQRCLYRFVLYTLRNTDARTTSALSSMYRDTGIRLCCHNASGPEHAPFTLPGTSEGQKHLELLFDEDEDEPALSFRCRLSTVSFRNQSRDTCGDEGTGGEMRQRGNQKSPNHCLYSRMCRCVSACIYT